MIFEYDQQRTFACAIDVDDAGNMCLQCTTTDGLAYYLATKTVFGKVHLLRFGPVLDDTDCLLEGFEVNYKKFDYKEQTIKKEVSLLINDGRKKILDVFEVPFAYLTEAKVFPTVLDNFINME